MTLWQQIRYAFLCIFFPERCIFCNDVVEPFALSCANCRGEIVTIRPPCCHYCGQNKKDCDCHQHKHAYDHIAAPFYYEKAVKTGILRLKRYDDPNAIRFFTNQMSAVIRREYGDKRIDGICFVPMTQKDERARGYNQSYLLAKEIAETFDKPLYPILKKIYATKGQKRLSRAERSGNVLGVFEVTESVKGLSLLLIDDVVTTGATADECAKMLKLAGAEAVWVACIAVTPPKREEKEKAPC